MCHRPEAKNINLNNSYDDNICNNFIQNFDFKLCFYYITTKLIPSPLTLEVVSSKGTPSPAGSILLITDR